MQGEQGKRWATDWSELPLVLGPQDILRLRLIPGGKSAVYALFYRPDFPAVRHGKRWLVSRDALRRWLEGQQKGESRAK